MTSLTRGTSDSALRRYRIRVSLIDGRDFDVVVATAFGALKAAVVAAAAVRKQDATTFITEVELIDEGPSIPERSEPIELDWSAPPP